MADPHDDSPATLPIHPTEPRNRAVYAAACAALNRALRDFEKYGRYGTIAVEIPVAGGIAQVCDLVSTDRLRLDRGPQNSPNAAS